MKKLIFVLVILIPVGGLFSSCKSCVRKTAERATELALSAVDGVADVLNEHGEETGKKVTDALGKVATGSLRSIGELLEEHADSLAQEGGTTDLPYTAEFSEGIEVSEFVLRDNADAPAVEGYFVLPEAGAYDVRFDYKDADGKVLFTYDKEVSRPESDALTYTALVLDELTPEKVELLNQATVIAIRIKKK